MGPPSRQSEGKPQEPSGPRRALRNSSLSLIVFGLFAFFVLLQSLTGHRTYNDEQAEHGEEAVSYVEYLGTGHFTESVFENWESEFLQMGAFVLFTVWLRQKGSPESKKLDGDEDVDKEPDPNREGAPWPVRVGGLPAKLYSNSLSVVLLALFVASLLLHAVGGAKEYNEEQLVHGGQAVSTAEYMTTSQFWFESFQNWQSEFLAVGSLAVLAIFLRQKGSPESKPVDHPHAETGRE